MLSVTYRYSHRISGGEMGGFWWTHRKGRRSLEDVGVNTKIILKCGLKKWGVLGVDMVGQGNEYLSFT